MIIRTQSRESIAEISHVFISEMMGEKSYYIFGMCTERGVFSGSKITLGIYPSKEAALKELDSLENYFLEKPKGIYRMN